MRIGYRVDATAAACLWLGEIPAPANQRITATERLGFMQAMGEYQVSGCRQIANALFRDVSKLLNGVFANYGRMTDYTEVGDQFAHSFLIADHPERIGHIPRTLSCKTSTPCYD